MGKDLASKKKQLARQFYTPSCMLHATFNAKKNTLPETHELRKDFEDESPKKKQDLDQYEKEMDKKAADRFVKAANLGHKNLEKVRQRLNKEIIEKRNHVKDVKKQQLNKDFQRKIDALSKKLIAPLNADISVEDKKRMKERIGNRNVTEISGERIAKSLVNDYLSYKKKNMNSRDKSQGNLRKQLPEKGTVDENRFISREEAAEALDSNYKELLKRNKKEVYTPERVKKAQKESHNNLMMEMTQRNVKNNPASHAVVIKDYKKNQSKDSYNLDIINSNRRGEKYNKPEESRFSLKNNAEIDPQIGDKLYKMNRLFTLHDHNTTSLSPISQLTRRISVDSNLPLKNGYSHGGIVSRPSSKRNRPK